MRKCSNWLAVAAAAAALAACGSGEEEATESTAGEEAADAMEDMAQALEPGRYETTVKIVELDMPDMPQMPRMEGLSIDPAEMMRSQMEGTHISCLTPEEAEEGLRKARQDAQDRFAEDSGCKVERDESGGGEIDMTIACERPEGTATMAMTGGMIDNGTRMRIDFDGDMAGQKMSFVAEHVSRRVGDCDGTEG